MNVHEKLNYAEFPAGDLAATRAFFKSAFGWEFVDYGDDYTAFTGAGLNGGFYRSLLKSRATEGAALLVFYSDNLEQTLAKVEACGGTVVKPTFSFPGGRRFHFLEPSGNEFGVWSTPEE